MLQYYLYSLPLVMLWFCLGLIAAIAEDHSEVSKLILLPLGNVESAHLEYLQRDLAARLGWRVAVEKAINLPAESYSKKRDQYNSSTILSKVRALVTGGDRILAIADADIYTEGLNFVFGEAERPGDVAVISLYRLHEEFYRRPANHEIFYGRVVKEAVHELGHTLGLGHCADTRCVMFFSNSMADTDRKHADFCSVCRPRVFH